LTAYRLKQPPSNKTFTNKWVAIILLACGLTGLVTMSQAQTGGNVLTIQNDSGQFALVKTVGPTRAVAKIPLDQKKAIHLAPGEYYILVRFGFAPKEYIYSKGEAFSITQEENKFSLTTITLHRVVSGMENAHEVSGEEFENFSMIKSSQNHEGDTHQDVKK
jgi:hypothetical protein